MLIQNDPLSCYSRAARATLGLEGPSAAAHRARETIEDLLLALLAFKRTYNEQWMLAMYDYRSPAQVRRDLDGLDAAA